MEALQSIEFVRDDGGREAAGFRGTAAGDCVCRAIAVASGRPYADVYADLIELAKLERPRGKKRRSHPRTGVHTVTIRRYLYGAGWDWVPTMGIGTGCTVHLVSEELPAGRLVVSLSRHYTAVLDRVVHDLFDPSRDGTRCVYGYWYKLPEVQP